MKSNLPVWFFPGILTLVVITLNLNSMRNGFPYDDKSLLTTQWPSLSRAGEIFAGAGGRTSLMGYRPITWLTLALNKAVSGSNPRGFHAVNIALHLIAALLVFVLSSEILRERTLGFLSALLFAIHPVHVQSIQKFQERGDLLAAVAIIAALWLFMRPKGTSRLRSAGASAAIVLLYAAALFSTENALALLGLWVLFTIFFCPEKSPRGRVRATLRDSRFWGLVAVTVIYFAVNLAVTGHALPFAGSFTTYLENPLAFTGTSTRILTAIDVIRRYLALAVWPYRLSPDYSYNAVPLISDFRSPQLLMSLGILASVVVAAVLVAKKRPLYLFACLFFLISISVVSNLFRPLAATMSEGLLYLPSLAICWALAQLFHDFGWVHPASLSGTTKARQFKPAALVLVCLVIPWGAKTYLRNGEWHDDFVLYRAAVRTTPRSARSHFILGDIYLAQADYLAAERQYYQALQIYPEYAQAAIKLAATCEALDRYPKALELLQSFAGRIGSLEEEEARLREMARVYFGLNDSQRAAELYEEALKLNETDAAAHWELGIIYSQILNQAERGRAHLRRSRELAADAPTGR